MRRNRCTGRQDPLERRQHELLLFEELADFVGEANDLNLAPFTGPKLPRAVEWLNRVFNKTR